MKMGTPHFSRCTVHRLVILAMILGLGACNPVETWRDWTGSSRNDPDPETTPNTQNLAGEVQRLLASMKVPMRQFRVSMTGQHSIVEFETDVSHHQEQQIVEQLSREGVVTEVVPYEGRA